MSDDTVSLNIPDLEDAVLIGSGGFGTVYKARQVSLRRTVAVKMVRSAVADERVKLRFEREIQAMGMLSGHPNIVTVYDSGYTADGQPYIIMDFMEGGSLADRLQREQRLAPSDVLVIAVKVAGALETAHQAGILHRDIKPENVMVSAYGEPKLGDFGIARLKGGPETATDSLTASIEHVSPDLLAAAPPSAVSDVYALGSTVFKLLAGRAAFISPDDQSIVPALARIQADPVPDLRAYAIPDPLARLVERAMAKDPAARHQTAQEFGEAAREIQRMLGQPQTPLPVRASEARRAKEAAQIPTFDTPAALASQHGLPHSGPAPVHAHAPPSPGWQSGAVGPPPPAQGVGHDPYVLHRGGSPVGYQQTPDRLAPPTAPPRPPGRGGRAALVIVGVLVALLVVGAVAFFALGTPAGYTAFETVTDDTGQLSVAVPAEWDERDGGPWRTPDGTAVGAQIEAAPDLDGFRSTWNTPGLRFGASATLHETYDVESLLDTLDFSSECTHDGRSTYSDAVYQGLRDDYSACGGIGASYTVVVAQRPGVDDLLVVQVQGIEPRDEQAVQAALDSFVVLGG